MLRWQSPNRGLVPPTRFIPVAESTGLIIAIGEFVLARSLQADRGLACAHGLLPTPFTTWVNVSGKQISAGGVSGLVQRTLETTGVAPGLLGLEVTETAIVVGGAAGERARRELQELHDLGVRIAIDDFGTGFSSLAHLRRFPVDVIKVDRSFIQGVGHERQGRGDHGQPGQPRPRARPGRDRRGHRIREPAAARCASSAATMHRASCSPVRCRRSR